MQLPINGLESHLKHAFLPIYVLTGDEPLQMKEAADLIRKKATASGFHQREKLTVDPRFKWQNLLFEAASLSLFSDKKLIDLSIPSGKPGTEGGQVLLEYASQVSDDNVLLIQMPKLDAGQKQSKWFKALSQVGVILSIWPIEGNQLIQWLNNRLSALGLELESAGLTLLAEHVEGNLLAAQQEMDKLHLIYGAGQVSCEQLLEAITDSARFDVFKLVDTALMGKLERSHRILSGLKAEGVALTLILWALTREIRMLCQIAHETTRGHGLEQVINQRHDIWQKRKSLVSQGVRRLSPARWQALLALCQQTDQAIKGRSRDDPWLLLSIITSHLSGVYVGN